MKASGSALSCAFALAALLLAAEAVAPAEAALGQMAASVQADRVSMKGQLRATSQSGYTVQQITTPAGTVVKEFVAPSGIVFAVSWGGPVMPDLQQLLGTYFTQLQATVQARRAAGSHPAHNRLDVRAPSLVVHAGGHMRQYFGMAYVPSLVPQNLSLSDLH